MYDELNFQIPVGRHGDCYDRYLIRIQEMKESLSIVQQCLANIPEGPVKVENYKIISPPKKHYKILYGKFNPIILNYYSEGIQTPKGLVL